MQKIFKTIIFLIFLFILSVFFIGLNRDTNYNTANQINKEIPDFKVTYLDKENFLTKNDIRKNNYTLINFWASWCAPCRKEHPNLVRLSKITNLKLIGINFKDDKANARNFLRENGNPFDILAEDKNGKNSVNFGVYGIPETILIDSDLKILKKYIGPLNINDVNEIRKIVKK